MSFGRGVGTFDESTRGGTGDMPKRGANGLDLTRARVLSAVGNGGLLT